MMDVQRPTIPSDDVQYLIQALFNGEEEPSDFRLRINQYSKTTVRNLFRDSLPKFASNLRDRFTNTFTRYFFTEMTTEPNELWKFVNFKDFWVQIKTFHDSVYSRSLSFNDVIKFFEESIFSNSVKVRLDYLEQRVVEKLDRNPTILNKDLARELNVSEKKISTIIGNLKTKGILLGSLVNFSSLDSYEFFEINGFNDFNDDIVFIDKYFLFPNFRILHGLAAKKPNDSSILYVRNKKIICNTSILNMGISIRDWRKQAKQKRTSDFSDCGTQTDSFYLTPSSKNYVLHLARNCETDLKRPNIKAIADKNDVSVRTLFRIKSKLKDQGIVLPKIVIENDALMEILLISEIEPLQFYDKVPFIKSFEVQDVQGNVKWLVFLSIFPNDFKFIYSTITRKSEIFQIYQIVGKKKVVSIDGQNLPPLQSNQKIYTK